MKTRRIHVTGASGSGVTTFGRALADALALPHHDTDDYLWQPTTPPYRKLRDAADRLRLMREMFLPRADWVLSGALDGWGNELVTLFDHVVFLATPREIRMKRLREREAIHFGADVVASGGWRHEETESFLDWASHYEDGTREGRSLKSHETWLATLPCPVLRLDGSRPLPDLVTDVRHAISA